ncbi:ribonuclease E/G [Acidocella sp. KAb 2-4]|uniref:Rne/Rng family ribonuclease n=1 Tax=Acidocella sp. KAb 2-4 TaxID=2885158 RepID=UPI001D07D5FB|nr:ribonuclease E/G [Acidocella sp. KAb 2-4]MCB5943637.1 Rne/Rng family ribonuclease [Acidocella sp. KAb 2-4]
MTKRMLIDASHAEETRVVVLDGTRLEDFDVETVTRKQIKGNIYLAKVIRVEPSLQAAFVEYGGNRHGFLAFGEIHPDYYQIPVADREKLLAMQAEEEAARAAEEAEEEAEEPQPEAAQALDIKPIEIVAAPPPEEPEPHGEVLEEPTGIAEALSEPAAADEEIAPDPEAPTVFEPLPEEETAADETAPTEAAQTDAEYAEAAEGGAPETVVESIATEDAVEIIEPEAPAPEQIGGDGDDAAEARERRLRQRFLRNYKIQDVIHRRQIMLVQVVKEERGNKGAALTTYLSLAGRFSVLMPNSPTGGGVSRKITSQADRRRLKEAMTELDVPSGMGLIVRTAGANRPKPEIKRDCEYLLRLWDDIRDKTMESTAPALIYEEANLIKRAIRDVYTRDVEDILVDGEEGFRAARDFMRMLMPSQSRKVQLWTEGQPLFSKHQVEAQLDAMLSPLVQLRSGGYIVINQTEALVAIDVNSGRSTRERNIEDTALRTNLEAAEEVAKQLRMRDLAGLIVIDFIDMESRKNNAAVERKLKDALKHDRARIQVGSISHFGLMEMSRQRLRPSLTEASLIVCPHCAGMGHVRSPESAALHILRAIEDEGAKFRAAEIAVTLPPEIAFYLFNHKRERLSVIEERYAMRVVFNPDSTLAGTNFRIERLKAQTAPPPTPAPVRPERQLAAPVEEIAEEEAEAETETEESAAEKAENGDRKRRRRRRGKRRDERGAPEAAEAAEGEAVTEEAAPEVPPVMAEDQPSEIDLVLEAALGAPEEEPAPPAPAPAEAEAPAAEEAPAKRRRSRGGRRSRTADDEAPAEDAAPTPVYADIADIFEAAERAEEEARRAAREAAEAAQPLLAEEPVAVESVEDLPSAAAEDAQTTAEPVIIAPEPPAPEAPAEEPAAPEPVVKPIIVGATEAPAAKKTGWWRR